VLVSPAQLPLYLNPNNLAGSIARVKTSYGRVTCLAGGTAQVKVIRGIRGECEDPDDIIWVSHLIICSCISAYKHYALTCLQ
jgi:hypothetical protein